MKVILKPSLELVGLGKQELGIQGEDRHVQTGLDRMMNHHKPRALKTGANGRAPAKTLRSPPQDFLEGQCFKTFCEVVDFCGR